MASVDELHSRHQADAGEPFFVLSDSGFSSNDNARVRIEGSPEAFRHYGGVDIVLYRVPHPLDFLEHQKDLHRVQVQGRYSGEGVSNTLSFLWDKWFAKSRLIWQQIFTSNVRSAMVQSAPSLSQAPPRAYHPDYDSQPQFKLLKQFQLIERFRYPIQDAEPIAPPKLTQLAGSSSNFLAPPPGNAYVPLGKLKPGLYLVEAYVGSHRAVTMLFVSDTVGITKTARDEALVWTANRETGKIAPDVAITWTDGNGVLDQGKTDAQGLLTLKHTVPQTSYMIGKDADGGVFVSENFYYDSEIYDRRMYIFTDRPLYKPGDQVQVKVFGRHYTSARQSHPIEAGTGRLSMIDSAGRELLSRSIDIDPQTGGNIDMPLPDAALPGGYQLRLQLDGTVYTAEFRVAHYAKPHFQVDIALDQPHYHPGDTIRGSVKLHYPDGKPVQRAKVLLDIKAQALSVTDNDAHTRFIRQLREQSLDVDKNGVAHFSLPAAAVPSRYDLRAEAREYGAFPVSARTQFILQPGPLPYTVTPQQAPKGIGTMSFSFTGQGKGHTAAPTQWMAIRLEDQSEIHGALDPATHDFKIDFTLPGGYSLFLRNADGTNLAYTSVQIPGNGTDSAVGLRLHTDKPSYRIGDVAHIILDFPHPVGDALLTLERDDVAEHALASQGGDWLQARQLSPTQWRVDVPITDAYAPNMTFSALYVDHNDFQFQNIGLQVQMPKIDIAIHTAKQSYRPGERVTVKLSASRDGKPVQTVLTASVVDNMVYVLQPELSPSIFNFFFHPLRDSVRTAASLSFYGYDLAWSPKAADSGDASIYHRDVKSPTLEVQPRRENIDTAAWQPTLQTNARGEAQFSFTMPDALSRWRITARAMSQDGSAGQHVAYVDSSKPIYLQWTGPKRFRIGDQPTIGLVVFNHGGDAVTAQLTASNGSDKPQTQTVTLQNGSNFVPLKLDIRHDMIEHLALQANGKTLDALDVSLHALPSRWLSWHSKQASTGATLDLPADATDIQAEPASTLSQQFGNALGALIDYPYGCVEQTASRLLPLTLALQSLPHDSASQPLRLRLQQRTQTARGRLMALAGPGAQFTWWGTPGNGDPLLTIYAYYADWHASHALGINLPPRHWQHVIDAYQQGGEQMPLLQRALAIRMMQDMGLPTTTLLKGLGDGLAQMPAIDPAPASMNLPEGESVMLAAPDSDAGHALALVLYRDIARRQHTPLTPAMDKRAVAAAEALATSGNAMLAAMPLALATHTDANDIRPVLQHISRNWPTMERALLLTWLSHASVVAHTANNANALSLAGPWTRQATATGSLWHFIGRDVPAQIQLDRASSAPVPLRISYQSATTDSKHLPIDVKRTLYELVPSSEPGMFDAIVAHGPLNAEALYVDQVTLTSHMDTPMRYGLLQVPLPPGSEIVPQRYGFGINDLKVVDRNRDEYQPLDVNGNPMPSAMPVLGSEKAQVFETYYADPIETLAANGKITVRHLIRFAQPGRFQLPPTRYYRMYQPDASAVSAPDATPWTVQ